VHHHHHHYYYFHHHHQPLLLLNTTTTTTTTATTTSTTTTTTTHRSVVGKEHSVTGTRIHIIMGIRGGHEGDIALEEVFPVVATTYGWREGAGRHEW